MRNRIWTGFSLLLLVISFMAFALMGRKPICIDSKVVEKIDRISNHTTSAIYRCSLRKTVNYDEAWVEQAPEISRRISKIERFLESLASFRHSIRISLLQDRNNSFKILDHEIFLGEVLFKAPGQLEKAIAKIWFREQASLSALDHPLFEESVTDLLLFAMNGNLEIWDPGLGRSLESANQGWPLTVKALPSYCQSAWRMAEHLQICSQWVSTSHLDVTSELVPGSLRPILTQSFIKAFIAMGSRERRDFLKQIPNWIAKSDFVEAGVGFSSIQEIQQNLVDLSSELSQMIRSLSSEKNFGSQKKFMALVQENLMEQGFNEEPLTASVDLWFEVAGFSETKLFAKAAQKILGSEDLEKPLRVLGSAENQIYFLPQNEKLPRSLLGSIRSRKAILVSCESPSMNDLDRYSSMTTRLLVIQSCDPQIEIPWKLYLEKDAEALSLEKTDLKFVDLHLPSLHLALKTRLLKPEMKLASLFQAQGVEARQRLGWSLQPVQNEFEMTKVQSQIEAIQGYRQ